VSTPRPSPGPGPGAPQATTGPGRDTGTTDPGGKSGTADPGRTGRTTGPDPTAGATGPDPAARATGPGRTARATGPGRTAEGARDGGRRLWWAMLAVGLLTAVLAGLGATVPSTYGGNAAVDEPQYLLTALSLWEDHDLDIADELAARRYLDFHDGDLPVQTATRPGGVELSPHDPLLPLLLAVPVGLGGWVAAKLTLAALAGLLAALLLWTSVRRVDVPLRIAAPGVALACGTAPLVVYGQQIYPELPAALAVLAAAAALTAPRANPRTLAVAAAAVIALPWLSVKYVPVAAVLALLLLHRAGPPLRTAVPDGRTAGRALAGIGRGRVAILAVLGAAAIAYAALHRVIYGGWTVYAAGDHFERSGEFGVVGFAPDYPGRSVRLLGLLVDRDFGLAAWQPAWLLLIPALAALLVRRPPHWPVLVLPLAAGWATATWVALTMHGFWWPGRQLVVVLPLAVLVILTWARRWGLLALAGVVYYAVLLAARVPWVLAPDHLDLHPPADWLLPDDRDLTPADRLRYATWLTAATTTAVTAGRRRHRSGPPTAGTARGRQ
jgi:hypothetical protein